MNYLTILLTPYRLKRLVLITLGLLFSTTAIAEIYLANMVSLAGSQLESLEKSKDYYKLNNLLLEDEIASKSSLPYVEQKAKEQGFTNDKPTIQYFLSPSGGVPIADLIIAAVLAIILWLAILLIFKDRPINLI